MRRPWYRYIENSASPQPPRKGRVRLNYASPSSFGRPSQQSDCEKLEKRLLFKRISFWNEVSLQDPLTDERVENCSEELSQGITSKNYDARNFIT